MRISLFLAIPLLTGLLTAWPAVGRAEHLAPFVASYDAWYEGKHAGEATMRLARQGAHEWEIDLGIRGSRGFAGIVGLNIEQSTVFDTNADESVFRPLHQSTTRKAAVFFNRKVAGVYDWHRNSAQWTGNLSDRRKQPVALQPGDMSALLINLAVMRDAQPGRELHYRFVDGGRVRDHAYRVSDETETITVGELSYSALRVERTNGGNDDTIIWVADGVPTPIRILQRDNGEDAVDLRLVQYQGAQPQ
ncbi:DUF3108 domain-containing protein [Luteimonas sp. BDR2-5]|nr:DUF3108 domain-containing protein [Luteimonas sp. BDR2-5]MCD9029263.1 DUF3108 domain-containing protein [Luteimonas sp. BDR2-5]